MSNYFKPNHAQMQSAVKGGDRYYRIRPKPSPLWQVGYGLLIAVLLIASFAALFVIAEVLGQLQIVE